MIVPERRIAAGYAITSRYYFYIRVSLPPDSSPQAALVFNLSKTDKMPFLELLTNVELSKDEARNLALELSAHAAKVLGKPESAFGINIRAGEVLTFAGNFDPCMLTCLTYLSA